MLDQFPKRKYFPRQWQPLWAVLLIILWTGINPFLRLTVYSRWNLKSFIDYLEYLSVAILLLEGGMLWILLRHKGSFSRRVGQWKPTAILGALTLFPVIWLGISLVLYVLTEFQLLKEAQFDPLYDSHFFVQQHPWSLTSLAFFATAILEEIFYRAWLPDFLQQYLQKGPAIVLSALLFTLAHASAQTGGLSALSIFLVALSFHYVRACYGVIAAIALHLLNNILVFASLVFSFSAFKYLAAHEIAMYALILVGLIGVWHMIQDFRRLIHKGPAGP